MSDELRKQLEIDATGAKKSVEDVNKSLAETNKLTDEVGKTSKMSLIDMYAGYELVKDVLGKVIGALKGFIVASNKQEDTIRKVNFLFGDQSGAVDELAKKMQKLTGTDDNLVRSMAIMAKTMGASNSNIEQIIKGAIGLNKVLGIDLESGVRDLTNVIQNGFVPRSLSMSLGLTSITDGAIKNKKIMDAVATTYEIAIDRTKSTAGAFETLANTIGDETENVGDQLNKSLGVGSDSALNKAIEGVSTFFQWMIQGLRGIGTNIGILVLNIDAGLTGIVNLFGKSFGALSYIVYETLLSIGTMWKSTFEGLGTDIYNLVHGDFAKVGSGISEGFTNGLKDATLKMKAGLEVIAEDMTKTFKGIKFTAFTAEVFEFNKAIEQTKKELSGTNDVILPVVDGIDKLNMKLRKIKDSVEEVIVEFKDFSKVTPPDLTTYLNSLDEYLSKYGEITKSYLDVGSQFNAMETAQVDQKYKDQAQKYKEMLDSNAITKEEYETYILKLENKAEKEKRKILKRQQKIDYAMTVINTSSGIMSAFKAPDNVTMFQKWAQAIAVGAKGALELATIAAQKFAGGGWIFGKGTQTSDSIPIMASNSEFMINAKTATRELPNITKEIDTFQRTGSKAGLVNAVQRDTGRGGSGTTIIQPKATAGIKLNRRELALWVQQEINEMKREGYDTDSV